MIEEIKLSKIILKMRQKNRKMAPFLDFDFVVPPCRKGGFHLGNHNKFVTWRPKQGPQGGVILGGGGSKKRDVIRTLKKKLLKQMQDESSVVHI